MITIHFPHIRRLALLAALAMLVLVTACQPLAEQVQPAPTSTLTLPPALTLVSIPTAQPEAVGTPPVLGPEVTPIALPTGPAMNEVILPTPYDSYVENLVALSRADLARRLSLDPAQIEVVDAASVTWPDGSLGCPQPGMMYTQVLVDGLRIRLRAGDQVYVYHSGGERPPFLCEK